MKTFTSSVALLALCAVGSAQVHTHGSMVGSLQSNSAVVWARASAAARVSVLYGTVPATRYLTASAPQVVSAADDFTAHITLTGLQPDTVYYYTTRIISPTNPGIYNDGALGTFKTPPSNSDGKISFLASADVWDHAQFFMFDRMSNHEADFYINLGDMPYADAGNDQAGYWQQHKDTRDHPSWLNFIEKFPVEAIWDDHEVANDWDKNTRADRVRWGTKAFRDYFPLPQGTSEIYRTIKWGTTLEVFLLDCRWHRDANDTPSVPTKTMLGTAQKAWLKSALTASKATFKVICSSVPVRWGGPSNDSWRGFAAEREEILRHIVDNGIANVTFLSADSHLVGVHNHREGIREFQCGPIAQGVGAQIPAMPAVRFRASLLNFVQFTVDPTTTPPTMTVEYFDEADTKIYREVIEAEKPATVQFSTDVANAEYQLRGPFYFHNRGSVNIPVVEPGDYSIWFDPIEDSPYAPADVDVTIPPNSSVVVASRLRETPGSALLFADTFDDPLSGYTIIDESTTNGPSAWSTSGGLLLQDSQIGGPVGSTDSDRPGTMLIGGSASWTNYTVATRFVSHDRGRIGVVFRYQDKDNYYRFVMDEGRPVRRLERKYQGVFTTLAETSLPYQPHNSFDIRCVAAGVKLKVIIDGVLVFDLLDTTFASGQVGLYVWQNWHTEFEDLVVTRGEDFKATVNVVHKDTFDDSQVTGWKINDLATKTGPSTWIENTGVLMQLSNIGDDVANDPIAKPGTVLVSRSAVPADMQFSVRMINYNNNGMGVVFRYVDGANHYRFSWNRRLRERQLQKVVNGNWSVLWKDENDYDYGRWYKIRVETIGSRIRLYVDGERLTEVIDTSHTSGTVGMYAWRNSGVLFDLALVQTPVQRLPVLVAVTENRTTKIHGVAPASSGLVYGLALSLSKTPSIPLAWLNPADPRILELTPDKLFRDSFDPSPLWSGFHGKLDTKGQMTATINWPQLTALKGLKIYCAGWTDDLTLRPIKDVFPTVELVFP